VAHLTGAETALLSAVVGGGIALASSWLTQRNAARNARSDARSLAIQETLAAADDLLSKKSGPGMATTRTGTGRCPDSGTRTLIGRGDGLGVELNTATTQAWPCYLPNQRLRVWAILGRSSPRARITITRARMNAAIIATMATAGLTVMTARSAGPIAGLEPSPCRQIIVRQCVHQRLNDRGIRVRFACRKLEEVAQHFEFKHGTALGSDFPVRRKRNDQGQHRCNCRYDR
jgi:hypothetical protein